MHIKYAFRMPSRIASRLTLCQAHQLERAPKEFGSAYGHSFKEHAHNYLRRYLYNGDERFLCRSVSCGVCARVGASHWEIGLISSVAFLSMPIQLVGLYAIDRWKLRRGLVIFCALTARLLWILIACLPFFPAKASVRFLLIVLVCSGLIAAIPGPAWHSLVRSLVPLDSLGKVFSKRLAWGTVIALTLTLAGGFFVDAWPNFTERPPLEAYSAIFVIGILFGLIGVRAITHLPEPPLEGERSESLRALMWLPLRDVGFRSLLGFIAFWNFSINLAAPFF